MKESYVVKTLSIFAHQGDGSKRTEVFGGITMGLSELEKRNALFGGMAETFPDSDTFRYANDRLAQNAVRSDKNGGKSNDKAQGGEIYRGA